MVVPCRWADIAFSRNHSTRDSPRDVIAYLEGLWDLEEGNIGFVQPCKTSGADGQNHHSLDGSQSGFAIWPATPSGSEACHQAKQYPEHCFFVYKLHVLQLVEQALLH